MMQTIDAIKGRRAVKKYDPNHELTEDEINQLMSLAMLSPTAFNIQNWRFVMVRDADLRQKICKAASDQAQVVEASLLLVLCADLKAWDKQPERYWTNAPKEVQELMMPWIRNYYENKPQVMRDEAMRSCGIAAQTLMLAAKSMGYDSCPMDGFDYEEVGRLIKLPEDHVVAMFVVIGKQREAPWPRPGSLAMKDVVIQDAFG